jgi:hypothetical protein
MCNIGVLSALFSSWILALHSRLRSQGKFSIPISFLQTRSDRQSDSETGTEPKKGGEDGGEIALGGSKGQYAEDSERDEEKRSMFDESRSKVHGEHDEESAIGYIGDGGTAAEVRRKDETERGEGAAIVVGGPFLPR